MRHCRRSVVIAITVLGPRHTRAAVKHHLILCRLRPVKLVTISFSSSFSERLLVFHPLTAAGEGAADRADSSQSAAFESDS